MATTIPTGFANADNTGVPAGTTLTTYTGPMTITKDGTVIENMIINGQIDIKAANVTIRNCIIKYNDYFAVDVMGVNATIQNCDIIGPGNNGDSPAALMIEASGSTLIGNDISGAEHAIVLGSGSAVVKNNYIHDGGSNKADPHIGGISLKGGQNGVLIEGNTVIGRDTADIFLQNNFGPISNVTINHNYLAGNPGYNIYVEGRLTGGPVTGISITNNVIVKGQYGDYSIVSASPAISGNVVYPAGTTVPTDPTSPGSPGSTPPTAPAIVSFSQDSGTAGDKITNDNTVTLTGTAAANSTVKVFDGATQIGTATANSSGAWSYTTAVLSDGNHSLTATATNASGQTSAASAALALKIDTTAPNAATIGTATSNANGGANLTGTAEANSTVKVFDGATQIGTATANGSGAWSYTTAALTTGSHSFTARAMDAAGNTGAASAAAAVNVGGSNPGPGAPTIASFSNDSGVVGDKITNDNTLTLTGTAAANSTVKVFDGATQIGTATANSSGAWSYTTAALSDGNHSLTATATNASGQTGAASAALALKIDTTAPNAPTIGTGSGGANLAALAAAATPADNSQGVTLTGTAEANSTIKVFDGTNQIGTATANSTGAWSYATGPLTVGSHSFTAKAMDAAGNTGAASAATAVNVTASNPSTGAPTIASFSNDSGVVGDKITNDNTLTLTGTAAANSTVKVFDGATQIGTATANSSGAWTYTTSALSDGNHSLTATTTTGSTPGVTPAIFEDFNPWNGNVSPDGIWRIAGTWTGTGGNTLQPGNVKFTDTYPGQTDKGFMYLTVPAGSPLRGAELQSLTTPGYSYGYYEVRMKPADVKGGGVASFFWIEQPNYGSHEWDVEFTLSDSWAGTSNPGRVALTTHPLDNTQWVDLGFNPSQDFHDYGFLWTPGRIDFTVDGKVVRTITDPNLKTDATGYIMMNAWSSGNPNFGGGPPSQDATSVYDWVKFYPGATSIPVDGSSTGGTSSASTPLTVTIDTKAPSAPTLVASTSAATLASTRVEVLTGTAEANSTVKVFDGTTQIGTATANASGVWSYTTAPLSTGSHSFTARAMDVAGNTGVASAAAVVNVSGSNPNPSAPTIASFSNDTGVAGDGITSDNTLALHGTAAANSTIKIYDGSTQIGTATANAAGSWDYITSVLTNATHVLTATATNASGQTSVKSAAVNVTVDTVAPTAPTLGSNSIVNTNQVKLSGTAEANSKVTVYDGTTAVGTATTSSTGAWSITTSALSNGTHTLTAKATDVAGNVSNTSTSIKPVIGSPTSPSPATPKIASFTNDSGVVGDKITNDNTLTLKGTAAANATVKLFDGTTQVGSVKADGSGNWTLTTSALKDGDHSLTATGTDSSGTSAASAAFAIKIDTHAPNAPSMGLYTQGGTAVSGTTTLDDLIVKGTAEANSKVAIFDGSKQIGTATAGSNGSWSYDTGHLDNGSHSFTAKAIDVAGNTSASSAAKGITVKDAVASLEFTSFYESSSNGVTIKGSADAFSQIKLFDGTKAIGTVTADAKGAWTYNSSSLSDTVHTFKAQALKNGQVVATSTDQAIIGSSGSNTLKSSAGDDIFIGNGHPDTFVFAANFGKDVIKDFDAYGRSHDTIQFSKSVFSDFGSVLNHASQVGQDVIISTGDDSLTLKNTKLGSLQSHDFHFA
jgi:glycosyl hydrolase family 16/Big-like domain-containing protein